MALAAHVTKGPAGYAVTASGDTSGETDSANIEAAINAIVADGGGHLWLGANLWIAGPIQMRNGLQVHGSGWASPVQLASGANSAMIVATDLDPWFRISNLALDGRREAQTGGTAAVEVMTKFARNATPKPPASCSWPGLYDVYVQYAYGDSFHIDAVETRLQDCFSFRPGGSGYVLDQTDQFVRTCTSGEAATHGFRVRGSEHQIMHSKAWWSGWQNARGSSELKLEFNLKDANAADWQITGSAHQLIGIHGQDGVRYGLHVNARDCNIVGRAGRQGRDGTDNAAILALGSAATGNRVDITVDNGLSNYTGSRTRWLTDIHSAAANNVIRVAGIVDPTATTSWTLGGDSGAGGATSGRNDVLLGQGGGQLIPTPYGATIIPDPLNGGVDVTATGNLTIANPRTDTRAHGTTFDLVVTQDNTGGRTVTFGSDYKATTAANTAANAVSHWRFRCIKTAWVQESFRTY